LVEVGIMENVKRIKIVKRGGAAVATASSAQAGDTAVRTERESRRETREVVSDWVRDHRRRAEEFRENYSALLDKLGFSSPLSCRTTGAS
jgi:hypothetical protein